MKIIYCRVSPKTVSGTKGMSSPYTVHMIRVVVQRLDPQNTTSDVFAMTDCFLLPIPSLDLVSVPRNLTSS